MTARDGPWSTSSRVIGCNVMCRRVIIRDPYEMIRGCNERGNGGNHRSSSMVVIVFGSVVER